MFNNLFDHNFVYNFGTLKNIILSILVLKNNFPNCQFDVRCVVLKFMLTRNEIPSNISNNN